MIGFFGIIELKLFNRANFVLWTACLNNSPTSITYIPGSSAIFGCSSIFEFIGKLLVMGMMLKASRIIVLIKIGDPVLSTFLDGPPVILNIRNKLLSLR